MSKMKVMAMVCAGLFGTILPRANADEWNQMIRFTFNGPVEIPGQVLPPGTYVFKLLDSSTDRDIVQVFDKDQKHLYGTFLAIPDYRLKPAGKPIVTFDERAAGAPEAVKAWFFPGYNYGHEFVYPKAKAMELAKANQQPVASMPNNLAANTLKPAQSAAEPSVAAMKQTPLQAQKPSEEEVAVAEVFTPPPASASNSSSAPASAGSPQELPKTGSPYPLIGLAGVLSLAAAGLLRLSAARS